MATTHTPGPWSVGEVIRREFDSMSYREVVFANGPHIGISGPAVATGTDDVQAESHARLIAAAPELLNALRQLLASAEAVHSFGLSADVPALTAVGFSDSQHRARSIIAKATGSP